MDSETSRWRTNLNYKMTGLFPAAWRVSDAESDRLYRRRRRSAARSDERQRSTGLEDSEENIRNMNQSHMHCKSLETCVGSRRDGGRFCWILTSGSSRQVLSFFFLCVLSWRWLQLYFRKGLIKTSRYGATHWLHWSSRWWQKSGITRKLEALLPQTFKRGSSQFCFHQHNTDFQQD